jgi:hypothetical protein
LNPLTASKLDHYLSRLFEGLSETANKGEIFDQHLLNEQSTDHFIDEIVDIALFATQIPLSIFTNLFHQRFEKHSMLEPMLEILQQFYIQVETQSDEFHLFAGDLSIIPDRSCPAPGMSRYYPYQLLKPKTPYKHNKSM